MVGSGLKISEQPFFSNLRKKIIFIQPNLRMTVSNPLFISNFTLDLY